MVVVGAGIAGLAACHELSRRAPAGTEVTLVEASDRIGGKLRVSPVAGIPVDEGAEAMLVRAPQGVRLATEVGLADAIVHPTAAAASILAGGVAHPLPTGTVMGIPDGVAGLSEGVLGAETRSRIATEADRGGLALEPDEDVAVGMVVAERLGREVTDRLVDPLLGGVYAGRADLLSLRATIPALAGALEHSGSLVRAVRRVRAAAPPAGGPVFATLRGGLGRLPAAVARAAGARILRGLPVRRIERTASGFRLTAGPVPRPTYLDADAVVVAAPAPKAAGMLAEVAPWAAVELGAVEYASVAIVTLAYQGVAVPRSSGVLIPSGEARTVKAVTYSSGKWEHLRDGDRVVVRGSVGRHGDTRVLHRDDTDLAALVAADVAALTGWDALPIESRVTRWGGALPQYLVGHRDRVRRITEAVRAVPGLAVCGAVYQGVGVPACVDSAHQAVAQVLGFLSGEAESSHG